MATVPCGGRSVKRRRIAALQSGSAAEELHAENANYFWTFLKHADYLAKKKEAPSRGLPADEKEF